MKIIVILCVIIALGGFAWVFISMNTGTHFGPAFGSSPHLQIKDIHANPESALSSTINLQGKITRQCPSSGCWFFLEDESGKQVRIELGHLGMKFPQWVGKSAKVEGKLLKVKDGFELVGDSAEFF
jgi:hypothetical protein